MASLESFLRTNIHNLLHLLWYLSYRWLVGALCRCSLSIVVLLQGRDSAGPARANCSTSMCSNFQTYQQNKYVSWGLTAQCCWAALLAEGLSCQCWLMQSSCRVHCSSASYHSTVGKVGAFPLMPVDLQRPAGAGKAVGRFMHRVKGKASFCMASRFYSFSDSSMQLLIILKADTPMVFQNRGEHQLCKKWVEAVLCSGLEAFGMALSTSATSFVFAWWHQKLLTEELKMGWRRRQPLW